MHINVAIKFKAVWTLTVETDKTIDTKIVKIGEFFVIPKRVTDPNKVKELKDQAVSEGDQPHLEGILSTKAVILDQVEQKS